MKFPFPHLTSFEDTQRNFEVIEAAGLFVGSGAPTFPAQQGNYYLRTDTPSTSGQQMYVNTAQGANWQPLLFAQNPARAYRSTAFTTSVATLVKVPIDAVIDDPGGNFDVATNHRYNVPVAGRYQVSSAVNPVANAGGQYAFSGVYKNGSLSVVGSLAYTPASGNGMTTVAAGIVNCAAGDYLEQWVWTSAAVGLDTSAYTGLSVVRAA